MNEATKALMDSARKWPYVWSWSGGFREIFKPTKTARERIMSVALLKPSAVRASEPLQ
ncbi:hypothetical protein D3C76_1722280 [compost metagenome]